MKGDVTKLIFKSDKKMSQRYQYSTKRPLMHLTQVRQLRQRSQIGPLWGLWPWGTGVAVRGTAGGAVEGAIRDVVGVRGVVGGVVMVLFPWHRVPFGCTLWIRRSCCREGGASNLMCSAKGVM